MEDKIQLLIERGVFETRNGSITINFDATGAISTIERKDSLYSKRHEKVINTSD